MLRRNLLSAAVLMAAGAMGCAHCDTCSDFPSPANAPAYGGGMPVFGALGVADAAPTSMTTPVDDAAPAAPAAPVIDSKPSTPPPPSAPAGDSKPAVMPPKPGL
jgi:hypothetical protein